jgi:hypothetical protein
METTQLEFAFRCHLGHRDRTAEHEQGEAEAASLGIPYPEPTRTLYITIDGIGYEIAAAIMSWRVIPDNGCYPDELCCLRCGRYLQLIAPNLLHSVPLAMCGCAGAFMTPVDDRDRGLLELAYPVSESDKALGKSFYAQLRRLRPKAFNES